MTELEQQEFVRISEENEEFKQAIVIITSVFIKVQAKLGINFLEIKSLNDVMALIPNMLMEFQLGEITLAEIIPLEELSKIVPLLDKYRSLVLQNDQPKNFA